MVAVTQHQVRAAAHVALLVDVSGNESLDLQTAYQLAQTSGMHSPDDLRAAQDVLVLAGVLEVVDGRILPASLLPDFLAIGDLDATAEVLRGRLFRLEDAEQRRLFGALGEVAVQDAARSELVRLGHMALADKVSRVSLLDDTLGYDILAPRLDGSRRLLEVKTSRAPGLPAIVRFFISRNEYRVGSKRGDEWALVACELPAVAESGEPTLAWCRASTLVPYLPQDAGGRWEQAMVELPRHLLIGGLPPAL